MSGLWLVRCLDAPDAASRRQAARAAHSRRLRSSGLRPVLYGPLVADDGTTPIGSLLIFEADDRAQVETFVAEDPFSLEGVWRHTEIHAFVPSDNSPNRLGRDPGRVSGTSSERR